jgi:protein-disulfide isomerase
VASAGGGGYTRINGSTKVPLAAYTPTDETLPPGSYTWYVQPFDEDDHPLAPSDDGTFTISDPDFVTYVGPTNCTLPACSTVENDTPELRWNPVDSAGSYRVWVALDQHRPRLHHPAHPADPT